MTAPTVHPPGRLISKRVANLKPGMTVFPAQWEGKPAGRSALVVEDPIKHEGMAGTRPVWKVHVRVQWPDGGFKTLKAEWPGNLEVDVVMPS